MSWYSTSLSVWAGATVIESPVCTPIGSRFSIEQMITQLSARSRITSSSYSFHPAIDRSMRISLTGLASRPNRAIFSNSLGRGGDAGALAAEDEGGPDDHGETDALDHLAGFVHVVGDPARRHLEADPLHGLLEDLAVLGGADGLGVGADQLGRAVGADGAALDQLHGEVERGLAAEGGEHRVGPLAIDDLAEDVGVERLDVGGRRELRVRHDRGRVRVGEDDAVALLAEHLARLRARVVELARLPDHDRPGADQQDRLDVVRLGTQATPASGERVASRAPRAGRGRRASRRSPRRGRRCRGDRVRPRGGAAR